jgi:hypothetical protein
MGIPPRLTLPGITETVPIFNGSVMFNLPESIQNRTGEFFAAEQRLLSTYQELDISCVLCGDSLLDKLPWRMLYENFFIRASAS